MATEKSFLDLQGENRITTYFSCTLKMTVEILEVLKNRLCLPLWLFTKNIRVVGSFFDGFLHKAWLSIFQDSVTYFILFLFEKRKELLLCCSSSSCSSKI